MQFSVLYFMQHAQIFYAIVGVLAVAMVHLLIRLKRLNKSMSHQPMNQKRFATYVAGVTVA